MNMTRRLAWTLVTGLLLSSLYGTYAGLVSPLLVVPVRMGLLSVLWRSAGESERRSMIANCCAGKAGPNP